MKRVLLSLMLMLIYASVCIAVVDTNTPVYQWEQYKLHENEGMRLLDDSKSGKVELQKAYDEFIQAAFFATKLSPQFCLTVSKEAKHAWMLNDAAYAIIKMHMLDKTVKLVCAKATLEHAQKIIGVTPKCVEKIESNLSYIEAQPKQAKVE